MACGRPEAHEPGSFSDRGWGTSAIALIHGRSSVSSEDVSLAVESRRRSCRPGEPALLARARAALTSPRAPRRPRTAPSRAETRATRPRVLRGTPGLRRSRLKKAISRSASVEPTMYPSRGLLAAVRRPQCHDGDRRRSPRQRPKRRRPSRLVDFAPQMKEATEKAPRAAPSVAHAADGPEDEAVAPDLLEQSSRYLSASEAELLFRVNRQTLVDLAKAGYVRGYIDPNDGRGTWRFDLDELAEDLARLPRCEYEDCKRFGLGPNGGCTKHDDILARRLCVVELRRAGLSTPVIGDELGVSSSTVCEDLKALRLDSSAQGRWPGLISGSEAARRFDVDRHNARRSRRARNRSSTPR